MDPGPCVTSHWPSPTLPLHPCSGTWCSHPGQGTRSRAHTHLAGTALPCPSTAGGAALQITQGCRGRNSLLRQIQTFPLYVWVSLSRVCLFAYLNTDLLQGVIFIAFLIICSARLHKTDQKISPRQLGTEPETSAYSVLYYRQS